MQEAQMKMMFWMIQYQRKRDPLLIRIKMLGKGLGRL